MSLPVATCLGWSVLSSGVALPCGSANGAYRSNEHFDVVIADQVSVVVPVLHLLTNSKASPLLLCPFLAAPLMALREPHCTLSLKRED